MQKPAQSESLLAACDHTTVGLLALPTIPAACCQQTLKQDGAMRLLQAVTVSYMAVGRAV